MSVITMPTPKGNRATFECRDDTTDALTVNACCAEDEYRLAGLDDDLDGVALDVGAHIGGVTVALTLDHPRLRVVAIEGLSENVALLRRNVEANGVADRVTVMHAVASNVEGTADIAYGTEGPGDFERAHRFIGGAIWQDTGPAGKRETRPTVTLASLVADLGPIYLMKIDCEGGEWQFLDSPAVSQVRRIVGEYHPRNGKGGREFQALLAATHLVLMNPTLDFGSFTAVR